MNRNAVKTFAQWARRHLHDLVRARLALFGVTEKGLEAPTRIQGGLIIGGQPLTLSATDLGQYDQLVGHYHDLSGTPKDKFQALVDEIAYTWFNRLAALRYMEVHGYAERALSSDQDGQPDPNLLRDALGLAAQGDLGEHVTPDTVAEWQRLHQPGEIYRRVLAAYAATFAPTMPFLFSREKAWLDLFLPDTLLNQDSIVRRMTAEIPEEDWNDIEIVGWLYQFYISERKDEVFAQKGKYSPRDIPAATQLFTPHWIVRYMVENSLGRVWLEAHPDSTLRDHMPYYLDSENPAPPANPDLTPESLTVMDPACGSGHILVYAFDLLAHIYRERGYSDRDIPALILEHNLHGLDIDERAAQLASFAVVMKARELNSRLFRRDMPQLNILQVRPTRHLKLPNAGSRDMLGNYTTLSGGLGDADAFNPNDWQPLVDAFADADHLGSLITPPAFNAERLQAQLRWLEEKGGLDSGALKELRHLVKQAELLSRKYDSVVANPPYMGNKTFNSIVKSFIEREYQMGKSDLFSAFIIRSIILTEKFRFSSLITQMSWMFLSTFESLRTDLVSNHRIESMAHMGMGAFGADFGTTAFVLRNGVSDGNGTYVRLSNVKSVEDKHKEFFNIDNRYVVEQSKVYTVINGSPIAYWVSDKILDVYKKSKTLDFFAQPRQGIATADNDRFLRLWHEVIWNEKSDSFKSLDQAENSGLKWLPYNKGGDFRRWYGNREYYINWGNSGSEIYQNRPKSVVRNPDTFFRDSITWSFVSSSYFGVRYSGTGFIYDVGGSSIFPSLGDSNWMISFLCSKLSYEFMMISNPTLNFQVGNVASLPIMDFDKSAVARIGEIAVKLSKFDWDNFETSWDFTTHPLLRPATPTVSEAFSSWQAQAEAAFRELQRLEEENNRYWIDAYGLQDELTPEVPDEQITIRRADLGRDARSLLSYAVGCMMGRYSLDEPGLIHAGQPFDPSRHQTFPADRDGILPVTLDGYFEDDVTGRFREFLRVAFAPDRVAENMEWVASALGGQKAGESAEARIRRYFATEFMSDHIQTYKKRPIYWLFTSGKKRGFGALVYLHRYDEGTLARLRTDYLLPLQRTLDAELDRAKGERDTAGSTAAKKQADKRVKDLSDQIAEVHKYDESLKHAADLKISLDLDDGVAFNYWLMSAAGQEYLTGRTLKGLQDLVYAGTDLKMADLEKKSQWKRDLLAQAQGEQASG